MADVTLNIRGRDDGAGNVVDSLRGKIQDLGKEATKVTNVRGVVYDHYDTQKEKIRQEFKDAREGNQNEYNQYYADYKAGKITAQEFNKYQKDFDKNRKELDQEEKIEIQNLEREQTQTMREVLEEFRNFNNSEKDRRQRDSDEFSDDSLRGLDSNEDVLRVFVVNWPEKLANQLSDSGGSGREKSSDNSDSRGGSGNSGQFGAGFRQAILGAARGDLTSTVMGGVEMAGGLMGGAAGKAAGIVGMVLMLIKELVGMGDKAQEAIWQTAAMRGGGTVGAAENNDRLVENLLLGSQQGKLGLTADELAEMVNQKAMSSKFMGGDIVGRTLDDYAFQRGFGADVSIFSEFERFGGDFKSSTTIGLDILNVLTRIEQSSLKSDDLSSLSEKLQSQQTIMSIQRAKRDIVDSDRALKILTAFESIGLSQKGEKAGTFLSQTIQGLGEGGSENEMLLKYEAAKRARPDLLADPAALRRYIRFESDSPEYMKEFGKLIQRITQGNQMAIDDIMFTMFPTESKTDWGMYNKWFQGDSNFYKYLSGQGIDKSRQSDIGLSKVGMYEQAESSIGTITEYLARFQNGMQEVSVSIEDFINEIRKDGIKVIVKEGFSAIRDSIFGGKDGD